MTPTLAAPLALLLAAPGPPPATECQCPCPRALPGQGLPALVHVPAPDAYSHNRSGRDLYRQRRFSEARAQYRAALTADPAFLGPRLNVACSLVQEGRFAEAVAEAASLAREGFVPWAEEIRQAADLAPLTLRPERRQLEQALADAGRQWGQSLQGSVLFLGRMRSPVRLPPPGVAGTFHLGLAQEIFAFLPGTGRYRQVTAEQGAVLGFLPAPDGASLVYVRAGRLVRSAGGVAAFRGLGLRRLDLATMKAGPSLPLPDDVERLEVSVDPGEGGAVFSLLLVSKDAPGGRHQLLVGDRLVAAAPGAATAAAQGMLLVDARGARLVPPTRTHVRPGCAFTLRDRTGGSGPPQVLVQPTAGQGKGFPLLAPFGAGLGGLPFPMTTK